MKRSTTRWTTVLAATALLGWPAAGRAQSPSPQTPAAQQPATPQPPAEPAARPQDPAATPAQPPVDQSAARQHLTDARNTLSQLTQLPAAAQLSGDARTQVGQLITNFNELITTQADWRAAYGKVEANLTSLIGPDNGDAEKTGGVPVGTTGATPPTGVAGTSGTAAVTLDPGIRAKLVEMRAQLNAFEKAAGGAAASAPEPAASASTPAATPAETPTPASTPSPAPTTAATPATATPETPPSEPQAAAAKPAAQAGHSEAMRHITAIETILSRTGESASPNATTTPNSPPASAGLDRTQIDQIRMHLAELKKLVGDAKK